MDRGVWLAETWQEAVLRCGANVVGAWDKVCESEPA